MAFTKITASGIGSTETVTLDGLSVINDGSFGGNVSVGGTLTYEDVTNIDSVGLITARAGVVVGSGITLSKDGDVFFTGIATGNGSGLTALNASNIGSGTVPTARLGSGTASSSTFLRGDSTFAAVTSTTINNNADNRLITGSGTANTLEGEANITFDGTNLDLGDSKKIRLGASQDLEIFHNGTDSLITDSGTGSLALGGSAVFIQNVAHNANMASFVAGAEASLFHNGSKKFETTTSGAQVTGSLTLTENLVLGDGDELKLGASSDMTISHSGSDFSMYNATGNLVISNASGFQAGEGAIVFKSGSNNTRWQIAADGHFLPASNNSFNVGSGSLRIATFYSNTSLNTSDRNEKNTITDSDLGLSFINKLRPVSYKWNQKEGENLDTKTHYGLIAQDIEETVLTEGKEITDFGFIDKSKEGHMNLAYNELISPLIKAVQELSAKNDVLVSEIEQLKSQLNN